MTELMGRSEDLVPILHCVGGGLAAESEPGIRLATGPRIS